MDRNPATGNPIMPPQLASPRPSSAMTSRRTLITTGAVFLVMVGLFILLGVIPAVDGKPLLSHLSPLVAQTLTTVGILVPTLMPYLIRTQKDSAISTEQLQNDHSTNLRDEGDTRHYEQMQMLILIDRRQTQLSTQVDWLQSSHFAMSGQIADLTSSDKGQAARINDIEDTIERK